MDPNGTDGAQAPVLLVQSEQPMIPSAGESTSPSLVTPEVESQPDQSVVLAPENAGQFEVQTPGNENSTPTPVWHNPETPTPQPAVRESHNQVSPVNTQVVRQFGNFNQFEEFVTDNPKNLGAAGQGLEELIGRNSTQGTTR